MATLGSTYRTLLDRVQESDPSGAITSVVEQQTKMNAMLQDAPAFEGNLVTGHRVNIRKGLPSIGYRAFNQGVLPTKSSTITVDEATAQLFGISKVDTDLAELNGDAAKFRANEDDAFVGAMRNKIGRDLFYSSSTVDPYSFAGFTPRFNSVAASVDSAGQIIKSGMAQSGGDYTSLWLIGWGNDTVSLIYPKGTVGGMRSEDLGKDLSDDGSGTGSEFVAWRTVWRWNIGLCIKDWRYVVRIANIDLSAALADTSNTLVSYMIQAYWKLQSIEGCNPVFYGNRDVLAALDVATTNKTNHFLSFGEWGGKKVAMFRGIPIRLAEGISSTESQVA